MTSKTEGRGGSRYVPMMFTEQGVAMLSSVLNSKPAIQINIQIMRVFTRIRQMLTDNTDLRLKLSEMKTVIDRIAGKQDGQGKSIDLLFEYIDRLQEKTKEPLSKDRKRIGFKMKGKVEK